jgi:hypothetical protein
VTPRSQYTLRRPIYSPWYVDLRRKENIQSDACDGVRVHDKSLGRDLGRLKKPQKPKADFWDTVVPDFRNGTTHVR